MPVKRVHLIKYHPKSCAEAIIGNLKIASGLKSLTFTLVFAGLLIGLVTPQAGAEPKHAIAMIGEPALPSDLTHLPYVNPDAPQGGRIRYGMVGTFDSVNPFILKGTASRGIVDYLWGNNVYETLMFRSYDEPFTMYGLLAEMIETDPERTWAEFTINEKAKWSDGVPVTPEDVIFTYDILTEKGRPPYSSRMDRIASIEKTGERKVKFTFNEKSDREFPLLIGLTPVLPKHAVDPAAFI